MIPRSSSAWLSGAILVLFLGRMAPAVDTTWAFNGNGNWTSASRWSNGEPVDSTYNAFIDDGDSAVTVLLEVARTVGSVSIGADDTLRIQSLGGFSPDANFTSSNGIANAGTLLFTTSADGGLTVTINNGALTNAVGSHLNVADNGLSTAGAYIFKGDLVNNGTVLITHDIGFNKSGATYSNYADFTVDKYLYVSNSTFEQYNGLVDLHEEGSFPALSLLAGATFNLRGGELRTAGIIDLSAGTLNQYGGTLNYMGGLMEGFLGTGTTYSYLGGTIIGTPQLKRAGLQIGPLATNPASFILDEGNDFSSNVHAGQQVTVRNTTSGAFTQTSANGFTNDGTFNVTGTTSAAMTLQITSGALTIGATGTLEFQAGGTGDRKFNGNLLNNGTVKISKSTTFNKSAALYTNNGLFTIPASQTLSMTGNGTFEQAGGTLDILGSYSQTGGTFKYLGGTINGSVELVNGTLLVDADATNPAAFSLLGAVALSLPDSLVPQNTTITVQSASLTSANGFTNNGSLLINGTATTGNLTITSGMLVNGPSGIMDFQSTGSGTRTFTGNLTNNGTVLVARSTTFNKTSGLSTNNSQFTVASGQTFTMGTTSTFDQAGGTLDMLGTWSQTGGTFKYSGGTIHGTIALTAATLNIGPNGTNPASFMLDGNSTLSAASSGVSVGQAIALRSTSLSTATTTSASGFTNAGSIILTGTSSGGTTLNLSSGTLSNVAGGLVQFQTGGTGARTFTGDLTNQGGTVQFDAPTTFNKSSGVIEQTSGITNLNNTLTLSNNSQFKLSGGTLNSSSGTFASGNTAIGTFNLSGGTISGSLTLDNVGLTVGPSMTGPFSLSIKGVNSGNGVPLTLANNLLAAGQTLTLQPTLPLGTGAVVTSASGFTNQGSIILIPGLTTTFWVTSNDTLTNGATGLIRVTPLVGAPSSRLRANILNQGTVSIEAPTIFEKVNATFTNDGQFIMSAGFTFDSGRTFTQIGGSSVINAGFGSPTANMTAQFSGGRLLGKGALFVPVDNSGASVEPGDNGVGKLSISGSYTQHSGGSLITEIGGTPTNQFDVLAITGAATLAGTLDVRLVNLGAGTYSPAAGDSFQILTAAGGVANQFEQLLLPSLNNNLSWHIIYSTNAVSLSVSAVPEPRAVMLGLVGILMVVVIERPHCISTRTPVVGVDVWRRACSSRPMHGEIVAAVC